MKVGFVGLGVMGAPMAGHLLGAGRELVVWSRTPGKEDALVDMGATRALTLGEMGAACDVVCLCVNRTEDVQQCLDDLIPDAKPGTLFIDHSTISPAAARIMHAVLAQRSLPFVDAPLTGGSMGAIKGTLTIFCGGTESDVARATQVMAPYARRAERVGGPGAGQMMKMANQIAVAGSLLGLCEALSFAKKAGLDLHQGRELLAGGAAGSWAFDNYGPKILAEDWSPGFSVTNQRKDLQYCIESAQELNAAVPGTQLVDKLLAEIEADGHGSRTTAALFAELMEQHFPA